MESEQEEAFEDDPPVEEKAARPHTSILHDELGNGVLRLRLQRLFLKMPAISILRRS